jgi:polar amino acid transport system substrate-binding protein
MRFAIQAGGNMKKRFYFTIAAVLLTFVNIAYSEETLMFSSHPQGAPTAWAKDGKLIGVGPELVKIIFAELGISVESKVYPWKRALDYAKRGDIDVIAGAFLTPERAEYLEFCKPNYTTVDQVIIVAKGKMFQFGKWEDLIGLKGVAIVGDSFGKEFDEFMAEKLDVVRVSNLFQGFKMLEKGRINFMPGSRSFAEIQARKFGFRNKIEVLPMPINTEKLYIAISMKSPFRKYLSEVNKKLKQLKEDGIVEQLTQKYIKMASSKQ